MIIELVGGAHCGLRLEIEDGKRIHTLTKTRTDLHTFDVHVLETVAYEPTGKLTHDGVPQWQMLKLTL